MPAATISSKEDVGIQTEPYIGASLTGVQSGAILMGAEDGNETGDN